MPDHRHTPKHVATRYAVSERTVQRWCRTHAIGHIRTPGGQYRFTDEQLAEFDRVYSRAPQTIVDVSAPNPDYAEHDIVVPIRRAG